MDFSRKEDFNRRQSKKRDFIQAKRKKIQKYIERKIVSQQISKYNQSDYEKDQSEKLKEYMGIKRDMNRFFIKQSQYLHENKHILKIQYRRTKDNSGSTNNYKVHPKRASKNQTKQDSKQQCRMMA